MARTRRRSHSSAESGLRLDQVRVPLAYRACDAATEILLYLMVVFTPWVFGTTLTWSIWCMNIAAYLLGGLLALKWIIRRAAHFQPRRWTDPPQRDPSAAEFPAPESAPAPITFDLPDPSARAAKRMSQALAFGTVVFLLYCLVSAANYRATYLGWHLFEYRECILWLPHSYDSKASWFTFWSYLGLACVFWAARDWLLEKTSADLHRARRRHTHASTRIDPAAAESLKMIPLENLGMPVRLERLLWVVCLNGALLGLEAILQRLDGTNKLLWLIQPTRNQTADAQFGPYAYRANAAAYFNLVWPVCLGFWAVLREKARSLRIGGNRVGAGSHVLLLPGAVLMAGCPIIATTRGGAIVAVLGLLLATGVLMFSGRKRRAWDRLGIVALLIVIVAFAASLGWEDLARRFATVFSDQMSHRPEIYANAQSIARDFPLFGTGPGSFGAMYQMYRDSDQVWAAYAHDDWLETRIDLGWVGLGLILLLFALVASRWFFRPGILMRWEFISLLWISLGGCLLHAKFDFPFQIYSILFLFVLLCSIAAAGTQHHQDSAV